MVAALDVMKVHGVKTLVVLDPQDAIVGVLTADELGFSLPQVAEELALAYLRLAQRGRTFTDPF